MYPPRPPARRALLLASVTAGAAWLLTACGIEFMPGPNEPVPCTEYFDSLGATPRVDGDAECTIADPQRSQIRIAFTTSQDNLDAWIAEVAPDLYM